MNPFIFCARCVYTIRNVLTSDLLTVTLDEIVIDLVNSPKKTCTSEVFKLIGAGYFDVYLFS